MLSEPDRMSLLEIEERLRASDEDLVRAFDILTRIGERPRSRRRPEPPLPRPVAPVPAVRDGGALLRLVQCMLATALVLPLVLFGIAAFSQDASTLALCVVFGALSGLVGYAAAAAVRARRR
jgi:hypothetical protein